MVEKKLIQETITELLDANVDKETIYDTLKDIGVEEEEIEKNYNEIVNKKESPKEESKPEPEKEPKEEEPKVIEKEEETEKKEEIDDFDLSDAKPKKTTKTDFIENNRKKDEVELEKDLNQTSNDIDEINQKETIKESSKTKSSLKLDNNEQLQEIEEEIKEIKAQIKGLTKIMKDILDENRKILNKL